MDFSRRVDRETYSATDMPEYPARVLTAHCLVKGIQAGAVAGTLVFVPGLSLFRKVPLRQAINSAVPKGIVLGVAVTMGMLVGKAYQGALDVAGVDDRAYRIAKNEGQTKVDKYSMIGGMAGSAVGALFAGGALASIVSFAGLGVTAGVGYYVLEKTGAIPKLTQEEKK